MREYHSCDPDLFRKVKEAVDMHQVLEYYGLETNRKGLCLCPFHNDKDPSLKAYTNGKGFYCFTCGTGGDVIKFAALYRGIRNVEAAKELAAAFGIPIQEPVTYREKREAEKQRRKRRELAAFVKWARMWLTAYRGLLCEAIQEQNRHFYEGLGNLTYVEHLLDCLEQCPDQVYADRKAVREIGKIERRIAGWYFQPDKDGSVS